MAQAAAANSEESAPPQKRVIGRPFKPGQSGNPSGRPKGVAAKARELIEDDPAPLLKVFLAVARSPKAKSADRITAAREYLDRAYGKAPAFAPVEGGDPLDRDAIDRGIEEALDELAALREARRAGEAPGGSVAGASKA